MHSQLLSEIQRLKESHDGGAKESSVNFSKDFQEKILSLLDSSDRADELYASQKVFKKLLNDPSARSKLESLHTARSFKFGAAQFGNKNWYKEARLVSNKLKSQADRRKFRQGLKGDVEFINYLNIKNLEDLLAAGDSTALKLLNLDESMKPSELFLVLRKVPLIKMLKLWNAKKADELSAAIQKISDALHFCQSMSDFFAHDDALEPALAVVCDVLRSDPNIGSQLRKSKGSFLSLAQCYQKQRSPNDKDFEAPKNLATRSRRSSGKFRSAKRPRANLSPPYKLGLCFDFQEENSCDSQPCRYTHECAKCSSQHHGEFSCPENG